MGPKNTNPNNYLSDLKINDVTMIRITNGRVSKYIVGADKIEEYLK